MLKLEDIGTFIQSIRTAAAAVAEAIEQKNAIITKVESLGERITSGITGDGDPAKLARELAPLQLERSIYEARLPKAEEVIATAVKGYCRECAIAGKRCKGAAEELLEQITKARGKEIGELWKKWGIPEKATNGLPMVVAYTGDKLQGLRDLIEELGQIVSASGNGREMAAGQVAEGLEACAAWLADSKAEAA